MLTQLLLDAGLLQFGWFEGAPMQMGLEMLPSYPDILNKIADEAQAFIVKLEVQPERLIATAASVPLGVAISLRTNIPLVYSRGIGGAAVDDLVGAYDIGHPVLMVAGVIGGPSGMEEFVHTARRVGLQIQNCFGVIDLGTISLENIEALSKTALLHLPTLINGLVADGYLPEGQAEAVQKWISIGGRVQPE